MSMYSLLLCCWKRVFAMTSVLSWQNSISLCPASFHTPRPNLPVIPGVYWLPNFAFQSDHSPRARHPGMWSQVTSKLVEVMSYTSIPDELYLNSRWAISNPKRWCCESAALNMPANLENSAVATRLEKVSFHSSPQKRQCQGMLKLPHNCTHFTG